MTASGQREAEAALPLYANGTASDFSGEIRLADDISDQMHSEAQKDAPIESCVVSDWVSKLDFLLSTMIDSNDHLLKKLMDAGHAKVWVSSRNVARQQTLVGWKASAGR
jgi:hypothetical protein